MSRSAILHFFQGATTVTRGDDRHEATAGTRVHMPTGQRHRYSAGPSGGWETVNETDAEKMSSLVKSALRGFLKEGSKAFD